MNLKIVGVVLLFLASLLGCNEINEDQLAPLEGKQSNLYKHFPELQSDKELQANQKMLALITALAEDTSLSKILNYKHLHIANPSKNGTEENFRRIENDSLWQALMQDSTIKVVDFIIPTSFLDGSIFEGVNQRSMPDPCECTSLKTGISLPSELCCDNETPTDEGDGYYPGPGGSTAVVSLGGGSQTNETLEDLNSGGGGGTTSSGTNTSPTALGSLIFYPADLVTVLFQDPVFYDKLSRADQLSAAEVLFWAGYAEKLNTIQNVKLRNDIAKAKSDYNYLYTYGRDLYDMYNDLLRDPYAAGLVISSQRLEVIEMRSNSVKNLQGQYLIATFDEFAQAAKPFIEIALIETGTNALFLSVKAILNVKWGVQLAKIGINTTSISAFTSRLSRALRFGPNNGSLNLKIGDFNLFSSSVNGPKKAYGFQNVSATQAEAIFTEIAAGRQITTVTKPEGVIKIVRLNKNEYVQLRKFSKTNANEVTIEFDINSIRTQRIELKFFP